MEKMIKQIPFELEKILRKKGLLILLLLLINVFLVWYFNKPSELEPSLSAYKAVSRDLSALGAEEQIEYLNSILEDIDGLNTVETVTNFQLQNTDYGREMAEHILRTQRDIYEKYKDIYAAGDYLRYTNSLKTERAFIEEILAECETVADYDNYIKSIEDNKNLLNGVSIFHKNEGNTFSARNIEKSFYDHEGMTAKNICFAPSRGVKIASQSLVTDLLLVLAVFLFASGLISEEKEKGLFYITRATRGGVAKSLGAKLAAMLICCFSVTALLFGANFIYAEVTTGICDLSASLQSISDFTESNLRITLGEYFLLRYLIKSVVLFTFGAALWAVAIVSSRGFVLPLCGVGFLALNYAAYIFIPAYSKFAPLKYLSFWGLVDPKDLLGGYLNFNINEYPVNRLTLGIVIIAVCLAGAVAAAFILFAKGRRLEIRRVRIVFPLPAFHGRLVLHEAHKILFTNRAAAVLLIFLLLIGYGDLGQRYTISVGEEYYRNFMLSVEGKLTDESEEKILAENARYENAFKQIELIEKMIASGEIDRAEGEQLKSAYQAQTMFYPYFTRVMEQYDHAKEHGGTLIYDTGYGYLFGRRGKGFLTDYLLLTLCVVFAFSNVLPIEERYSSWNLISATAKGKRKIIISKIAVCTVCVTITAALPWVFRISSVSKVFPLGVWAGSVSDLPMYFDLALNMPIRVFITLMIILQILTFMIVMGAVLLISQRLKNGAATLFACLAFFAVPPTLAVMGIDFAKWFSLYPLYALSSVVKFG